MSKETKHTPFREALMWAWVRGWYCLAKNDDGKRAAADEIIKDFPAENAAPELLEACKSAEELLANACGSIDPILPVLNKLSAAIAKATKE